MPRRSRATATQIFDLHAAALAWLEDYTGIPYPFGKFDFVLIPSFQFGGMEHAGAILYNAAGLMLDESATQNQLLGRASVIAHETAHMWFGDLVTMRWFNDVWMKEVFANFMAAKIVNPSFPQVNHELRFLLAHYPAAYQVDRTAGTNADPPDAGQPERRRADVRPDHLREGADRDAAARADGGRQRLPRRAARVPEALSRSATPRGPIWSASSTRARRAIWPTWSRAWVEERGRPEFVDARCGSTRPVECRTSR